jgi:hypothetical protein
MMSDEEAVKKAETTAEIGPLPIRRQAEKNRTSSKDLITVSLSLLALTVSIGTAYWTIIRQLDDMRLVIDGSTAITLDQNTAAVSPFSTNVGHFADTGSLRIVTNAVFTFVNLGNRPAAVTSILLWINQPPDEEKREPCEDTGPFIWVRLDIDPFVVKPGEISTQPFTFPKKSSEYFARLSRANLDKEHFLVEFCGTFNVVTPADEKVSVTKQIMSTHTGRNPAYTDTRVPLAKQTTLFRKSGTVFDN